MLMIHLNNPWMFCWNWKFWIKGHILIQVTKREKCEVSNGSGQDVSFGCAFFIIRFIHLTILIVTNMISLHFGIFFKRHLQTSGIFLEVSAKNKILEYALSNVTVITGHPKITQMVHDLSQYIVVRWWWILHQGSNLIAWINFHPSTDK